MTDQSSKSNHEDVQNNNVVPFDSISNSVIKASGASSSLVTTYVWRVDSPFDEWTQIQHTSGEAHASGVFANVYKCTQLTPTVRQIAIRKSWPTNCTLNEESAETFMLRQVSNYEHCVCLLYHKQLLVGTDICQIHYFNFMPSTLKYYVRACQTDHKKYNTFDICVLSAQVWLALDHLQLLKICHRDVKPDNFLFHPETYKVELCDFGSAKILRALTGADYSSTYRVTRYYRAPELLQSNKSYGLPIDWWSAACIHSELLCTRTLWQGRHAREQWRMIVSTLGEPSTAEWHKLQPYVNKRLQSTYIAPSEKRTLNQRMRHLAHNENIVSKMSTSAIDMLLDVFTYNDLTRATPSEVLNHSYFDQIRAADVKLSNGLSIPIKSELIKCIESSEESD